MSPESPEDLPLLVLWEEFLLWLFPALEKLPRSCRFTLTTRAQGLALDVQAHLVDARFGARRVESLRAASSALEKLRVLLRLAHGLRVLPPAAYRHGSERVDEAGRMLGGWLAHATRK